MLTLCAHNMVNAPSARPVLLSSARIFSLCFIVLGGCLLVQRYYCTLHFSTKQGEWGGEIRAPAGRNGRPGSKGIEKSSTVHDWLATLPAVATAAREAYRRATPFPFTSFDSFMPDRIARAIAEEISDAAVTEFRKKCGREGVSCFRAKNERLKTGVSNPKNFGPATREAFAIMRSAPFVRFLEELSGIKGLKPDPSYSGSGLHMTPANGSLEVHADFNYLEFPKGRKMDRRVNVFLYLNENWEEAYGGHLELWRRDMTSCEHRLLPIFNRFVAFSTTDFTYHGHPDPLTPPQGRSRRSLALYYYTHGRDDETLGKTHSTLFQKRACVMKSVASVNPVCPKNVFSTK